MSVSNACQLGKIRYCYCRVDAGWYAGTSAGRQRRRDGQFDNSNFHHSTYTLPTLPLSIWSPSSTHQSCSHVLPTWHSVRQPKDAEHRLMASETVYLSSHWRSTWQVSWCSSSKVALNASPAANLWSTSFNLFRTYSASHQPCDLLTCSRGLARAIGYLWADEESESQRIQVLTCLPVFYRDGCKGKSLRL